MDNQQHPAESTSTETTTRDTPSDAERTGSQSHDAMPPTHGHERVAGVMGASSDTARSLELLRRDFTTRQHRGETHFVVGLIAPDGSDIIGFGKHLVDLLDSVCGDDAAGEAEDDQVSMVPVISIVDKLSHLESASCAVDQTGCVVLHRFHFREPLPASVQYALVQKFEEISEPGTAPQITVLHAETPADWRTTSDHARFAVDCVTHIITLQIPSCEEVTADIIGRLEAAGIDEYCVDDLTALVRAADGAVPQRGVQLSEMLTSQIVGGFPNGPVDLRRIASDLGLDLVAAPDTIRNFVGFDSVNEQLDGIVELARNRALLGDGGLHCAFLGNAGSGKTEAARALALRLHRAGICTRPTAEIVSRADLVGEYVGQTAPRVQRACERARGGVLFIDEAYSLNGDGTSSETSNDYGHEALAELVLQMENMRDELVVVMAGYPKPMEDMMRLNPGLQSRITFDIEFPDLSLKDLMKVFKLGLRARGLTASDAAMHAVAQYLRTHREDEGFGNSRGVRSLIGMMLSSAMQRLGASGDLVLEADDLKGLRTRPTTRTIGFGRYL